MDAPLFLAGRLRFITLNITQRGLGKFIEYSLSIKRCIVQVQKPKICSYTVTNEKTKDKLIRHESFRERNPIACWADWSTNDDDFCVSEYTLPPRGGGGERFRPQSIQSDGPVRFLILCSISIFLLASLVAGR